MAQLSTFFAPYPKVSIRLTVSRLNLLTLPPPCFRSDSAVFSTVPRRRYRPTPHLRWPGFPRSQRRLRHLSKRWHRHATVACRATGARATGARGSSPRFSIHAPATAGGAHRAAAPTTRKSASSTNVFPSPREPRPGRPAKGAPEFIQFHRRGSLFHCCSAHFHAPRQG